jgi:predicted nucleotidyltransferase
MKNISLDLSGKVDSVTVDLLTIIDRIAKEIGVDFFVIGATARALILEQGFKIRTGRATEDVDLGVRVDGWNTYRKLIDKLLSTEQFVMNKKMEHRLRYKGALPLDVTPFGKIESPPGSIAWPPDQSVKMSVLGFNDVLRNALRVRLGSDLTVLIASIPGMAVLKLIAWNDRRIEFPEKDVADLALLLKNYAQTGNLDRLYGEQSDLLEAEGHDQDRAGARLLGQDMSRLMTKQTRTEVLGILRNNADPEKNDNLIIAVSGQLGMDKYEEARILLECLIRGIEENQLSEA